MKISVDTITRTACLGVALVNAVLQIMGLPHIEIADETITAAVSSLALIATTLWAWWKNNNFTPAAREAQKVLDGLKDGEINEVRFVEEDE